MNKTDELIKIAKNLASATPEFRSIKGAGRGDHSGRAIFSSLSSSAEAVAMGIIVGKEYRILIHHAGS